MEINLSEILNILSTPLALRKSEMIEVLMKLTKSFSFFIDLDSELGNKMLFKTCELLSTEYHPAGTVIIKQILFSEGEKGSKFYIILQGKIKLVAGLTKGGVTDDIEIAQLETGKGFGELALIKEQPRRATAICTENCYFMTLSKGDYMKILGKSFLKKLEERINFLHSLKIFNKISKKALEKLSYFFKLKTFRNKEFIYLQDEESDGVFFIISGEIELTSSSSQAAKSDIFPKIIKIALISDKDMFGDEEVMQNIPRKYSARCTSKVALLLWISKYDFLNRVNKDSLKQLETINFVRNSFRNKRLESIASKSYEITPKHPQLTVRKSFEDLCRTTKRFTKLRVSYRSARNKVNIIDSLKRKSLLNVISPTAMIRDGFIAKHEVKSTRYLLNSNGFQPFNKNPSGSFNKIQEKIRSSMLFK